MTACLDTDVLIDFLRGLPQAQAWMNSTHSETLLVPGIVAMELVAGSRDKRELEETKSFLDSLDLAWPDSNDFARAFELLVAHPLSTGLSIPDCIISAMALSRSARLYTFNLKHYRAVAGLEADQPYWRP